MPTQALRTALFIDADNVSPDLCAEVLERLAASQHLLQHRRAYGSVQKANEFAEFARNHAIRFLPSTFAGPNATDLALAIDAVELVLRQPVDEFVLVSSDRDFAPLIVRLRELGCRVTGFGQQGKSARDVARDYLRVYDDFSVIGGAKPSSRPARKTRATPALPAPPAAPPAAPAARKRGPARAARAEAPPLPRTPRRPPPAAALPADVMGILDACPDLRNGAPMRLNGVGKALHDSGVLTKSGRPSALFKKLGTHFEMLPAGKPETVRFIGAAGGGTMGV